MDPEQALTDIRRLISELEPLRQGDDVVHAGTVQDEVLELMEKFEALDEWLTKGGFPPSDWRHGVPARG